MSEKDAEIAAEKYIRSEGYDDDAVYSPEETAGARRVFIAGWKEGRRTAKCVCEILKESLKDC